MSPDRQADSLALAQQVDALCDRFEEGLRAGKVRDWWDWLPPVGPARGRALIALSFDPHALRRNKESGGISTGVPLRPPGAGAEREY
jgi:hypothetical protein